MKDNEIKTGYKSINTPICDFVKAYSEKAPIRLHMPGHKGVGGDFAQSSDITEIDGADSLYESSGIISESENNAGALFGAHTFYSAEGSSLSIRAMLRLIDLYAAERGEKTLIFAARNAHRTFLSAAVLLGFDVEWLTPENPDSYLSCNIDKERVGYYLQNAKKLPTAVYLTSPDYLGNVLDIEGIAEVCHSYGVILAVDNAHGAYLKFLPESRHPIDLGADLCADSAHKTLPALTGAAYLHVSERAPKIFCEQAKNALALFGSTSPSYLILQSLDKLNRYLADGYENKLKIFTDKVCGAKKTLKDNGFVLVGDEPLKITISAKPFGYTGKQISEYLKCSDIFCEFCDEDFIVFMLTPETTDGELGLFVNALLKLPQKSPLIDLSPAFHLPKREFMPRCAARLPSETVETKNAVGRTVSEMTASCPPAVPIVVGGEKIDEQTANALLYYGIKTIKVIK